MQNLYITPNDNSALELSGDNTRSIWKREGKLFIQTKVEIVHLTPELTKDVQKMSWTCFSIYILDVFCTPSLRSVSVLYPRDRNNRSKVL